MDIKSDKKRKLDRAVDAARVKKHKAKSDRESSTKLREPSNNSLAATRDAATEQEQHQCVYIVSKTHRDGHCSPTEFEVLDVFTDARTAIAGLKRSARQVQWWQDEDFEGWEQSVRLERRSHILL